MIDLPPVINLATTVSGGAGVALRRSHRALVAAGVDSRILVAWGNTAGVPSVERCLFAAPHHLGRLLGRLGLGQDRAARMLAAMDSIRAKVSNPVGFELFSPPFSRQLPERHPWLRGASIVHLHWVAGMLDWPRFFSTVSGPVVFTLHDQNNYLGGLHYDLDARENPWLAPVESQARDVKRRSIERHRVTVVGNSEWNTNAARESGFFPGTAAYATIPYALDTDVFAPRPKAVAREALGLPPDSMVIGFACDDLANRRKGFSTLVEALRRLPSDPGRKITLLSFGRTPDGQTTTSVSMPWIHLGFIESDLFKAVAYSAMDIFVVPSRAEAFGQTAIEAMACGVAVIASAVGGLVEAVDGGRGGLLVPADDPDALSAGLSLLLGSPGRRQALASAGRGHVVRRHNPAAHAHSYIGIFKDLRTTS